MLSCPSVDPLLQRRLLAACPTLVLASQSPNRRKVLEDCGISVMTRPQDIWEICGETQPDKVVCTLARQKLESYLKSPEFDPSLPAVGVDTLVSMDGDLLGKPRDRDEAHRMLGELSGKVHQVYSGMCVYRPGDGATICVCDVSDVHFRELSEADISWYIGTGDCIGAAGAYKIQGNGFRLISEIRGSYSNIIGIPLERLLEILV